MSPISKYNINCAQFYELIYGNSLQILIYLFKTKPLF